MDNLNNRDIVNRIKFIISEMNLSQGSFAKRVDSDPSNLSKHLSGKLPVSEALINRIVVNLGVSKQWLKYGTDVPFPRVTGPEEIVVPPMHEGGAGVPVYDVDVTAGTMSRERMFADDRIIGRIDVPGFQSDCKVVRVSGDSMMPVIHDGDYIAVREVHDRSVIFWGQIYVVLLEEYRMVKYVRRHSNPRLVILHSANPDYDDIELPLESICGMFFVNNIIHIDTRM